MTRFGLAGRLVLLCAVALLSGARAMAATSATMTIGESQQGKVKGSKQTKGGSPDSVIELLSVTRPGTDAATGMSSGKRSSPGAADTLMVTKYYNSSSVQLEEAAATNQVLPEVTIVFETAAASNAATNSKVKGNAAKNAASGLAASTSKTAQVLRLKNVQVDEVSQTRNLQRITLEYQSIEVTYTSGKPAAATDDWETP